MSKRCRDTPHGGDGSADHTVVGGAPPSSSDSAALMMLLLEQQAAQIQQLMALSEAHQHQQQQQSANIQKQAELMQRENSQILQHIISQPIQCEASSEYQQPVSTRRCE